MSAQISFSMDLLRTYVAVVETASFTKASSVVLRSQPTISDHIRRLEHLFDVSLLSRSAQEVRMTPEGDIFLNYAKKFLALNEEMIAALRGNEFRTRLAICVQDSVLSKQINKVYYRMKDANVDLEIMFMGAADKWQNSSSDGNIFFSAANLSDYETLAVERLVWVESGRRVFRADSSMPIIFASSDDPLTEIARDALAACKIPWHVAHQSTCGCLYALKAGAGVMALPEGMLTPKLRVIEGTYNLPDLPLVRTFFLAHDQSAAHLADVIRRFMPPSVALQASM